MRVVKLCQIKYIDEAIEAKDPRNVSVYWLWGKNLAKLPVNTDSYTLLQKQQISITPISLNLGDQYLQETKDFFQD